MPDKSEHPSANAPCLTPRRSARPDELADFLNAKIFHPLAWRLALALRGTSITPNQLSIAGGLVVVGAGILYTQADGLLLTALAFALHLSWHVLDGADGDLARLTGRSSRRGEIIDGICDYAGHIVLYMMLASVLTQQIGLVAWLWAIAAGGARIIQAIFYESQRRQYQFWGHRVDWLRVSSGQSKVGGSWIEALGRGYAHLSTWLTPSGVRIDHLLQDAQGDQKTHLRALIKTEYAGVMRRIRPLSANYRTIAIGLSMLAGSPLYAFIFEALVLNAWLIWSILLVKNACRRIFDQAPSIISR